MLAVAYAAPPVLMLVWMARRGRSAPNVLRWFDLVYAGTTCRGRGNAGDRRSAGRAGVPAQSRRADPEPAALGGWRQHRGGRARASPGGICRS